jgi:hypothetical protein
MHSQSIRVRLLWLLATIVLSSAVPTVASGRERAVEIPLRNWTVPAYEETLTGERVALAADSGRGAFVAIQPCRLIDTRRSSGEFGGPKLVAGLSRTFLVPSGPCPSIPPAAAYSVNITVTQAEWNGGFITVYPTGTTRPIISSLNFDANEIRGNSAIAPASATGSIEIYTNVATHVIVDINGFFEPAANPSSGFFRLRDAAGTDFGQVLYAEWGAASVLYRLSDTEETIIRATVDTLSGPMDTQIFFALPGCAGDAVVAANNFPTFKQTQQIPCFVKSGPAETSIYLLDRAATPLAGDFTYASYGGASYCADYSGTVGSGYRPLTFLRKLSVVLPFDLVKE